NHPSHELANKYFTSGYGSIITFGIKGGLEAGKKLINNIELWSHVANVGDAKSLIIHPASTTHQQPDEAGLKKSGVTEELVRLAVGIEDIEDILGTLDAAIHHATGEASIEATDEDAVQWLVSSPFDRSEGLRQKTRAVNGSESLFERASQLSKNGYQVIKLADAADTEIDVIYTDTTINAETANKAKIIWTTEE